jgi:hypothetical protein
MLKPTSKGWFLSDEPRCEVLYLGTNLLCLPFGAGYELHRRKASHLGARLHVQVHTYVHNLSWETSVLTKTSEPSPP